MARGSSLTAGAAHPLEPKDPPLAAHRGTPAAAAGDGGGHAVAWAWALWGGIGEGTVPWCLSRRLSSRCGWSEVLRHWGRQAGEVPPACRLMFSGTAGAVSCVTFIWFSAPDLALTQLTVEVVTTLLILLGLRWLPPREPARGVTMRTPGGLQGPAGPRLPHRGECRRRNGDPGLRGDDARLPRAHLVLPRERTEWRRWAEVVNVMLVDFRGFEAIRN